MKGLELAALFYQERGKRMIEEDFPQYQGRIAVGLVGEGSECFGFDDQLSRDHDWGPSFCLWLTAGDCQAIGQPLSAAYAELMQASFRDWPPRRESELSAGRVGVSENAGFYRRYTGFGQAPQTVAQWRAVKEETLALVTNGQVFYDPLGEFSRLREDFLAYYPEDLRLKKIAARCALAAQSGQYNLPRSLARKDYVAAFLALAEFTTSVLALGYLFNKQYRPFYKWAHRGLGALPVLGEELGAGLGLLAEEVSWPKRVELVEKLCAEIAAELCWQGLSSGVGDFLLEHAAFVQDKIQDAPLRRLHIMAE